MLDMKKNTGAKVSALVGSTLALGTIFGLVSRNAVSSSPGTPAPQAAAPAQPATSVSQPSSAPPRGSAPTAVQPSPTPVQQSDSAAAPPTPIDPTATPVVVQQIVRQRHTRTRSS